MGYYFRLFQIQVLTSLSYALSGHIEMRYCDFNANGGSSTPDCFDGNYLDFVEDVGVFNANGDQMDSSLPDWQKMPVDTAHPERGMLSGGQSVGTGYYYRMTFQLPMGLSGDEIYFVDCFNNSSP